MSRARAGMETGGDLSLVATADLAATMLAVAIMLLAIVLAHRLTLTPVTQGPPQAVPVEATEAMDIVIGRPLSGQQALESLRLRATDPPSAAVIDLLPSGRLRAGDPQRRMAILSGEPGSAIGRFLSGLPAGRPVALFVFDDAAYPQVRAAIDAAGREWLEFSPPKALRTADGGDFRRAFKNLAIEAQSPQRFRGAMAELLAGGDAAPEETSNVDDEWSRPDLLERLKRWLARIIAILALAAGAWMAVAHERRRIFDCNDY